MKQKNHIVLLAILGFFGILLITVFIIDKLSGDDEMFILSVPLGFILGFAWLSFLNNKLEKTENKTPEKSAADDPYAALELIDKSEREKYPESVRNITWDDIRKKAQAKRIEIYNSAHSFDDEKELIDISVRLFRSRDNIADAPAFVVKAALRLIGYDEELVDPLYEMLYDESTRVYNVLLP